MMFEGILSTADPITSIYDGVTDYCDDDKCCVCRLWIFQISHCSDHGINILQVKKTDVVVLAVDSV